jgi:hypothetical protein
MYFQKVICRKTFLKLVFCWRLEELKVNDENKRIRRHGSADPDPHQNVMDPQYCLIISMKKYRSFVNN